MVVVHVKFRLWAKCEKSFFKRHSKHKVMSVTTVRGGLVMKFDTISKIRSDDLSAECGADADHPD